MKLIRLTDTLIVNLDQVASIRFYPYRPAGLYDYGFGPEHLGESEAKLALTLTSLSIGGESGIVMVYGAQAEKAWDCIYDFAINKWFSAADLQHAEKS